MSDHKHRRKTEICPNCQTILRPEDNFCPSCGQENHDLKVPIGHLVYEFVESITHFDTKLWNTIKAIFTKPGLITKDFVEGRRARHVHPVRFYIFMSFVFFLLLTKNIDKSVVENFEKDENGFTNVIEVKDLLTPKEIKDNDLDLLKNVILQVHRDSLRLRKEMNEMRTISDVRIDSMLTEVEIPATEKNRKDFRKAVDLIASKESLKAKSILSLGFLTLTFDSQEEVEEFKKELRGLSDTQVDSLMKAKKIPDNWFAKALTKRLIKLDFDDEEHRKALFHAMIKSGSATMFILMPFVALLLLWMFFRKKYYYEHLIFSIHIHTFYFLVFSVVLAISIWISKDFGEKIIGPAVLLNWIYLLASLKYVYNKSWGATILRFMLMSIPYLIVAFSLFAFAMFYGFLNS